MKETNYWQQFLRTGRVEDYLSYLKQKPNNEPVHKGEDSGAGSTQCYRTDIKSGTFRGI